MNKPREFWIYMSRLKDWSGIGDARVKRAKRNRKTEEIHVIERSAYDHLEAKLKIAVNALELLKEDVPWGVGDVISLAEHADLTIDAITKKNDHVDCTQSTTESLSNQSSTESEPFKLNMTKEELVDFINNNPKLIAEAIAKVKVGPPLHIPLNAIDGVPLIKANDSHQHVTSTERK